MADKDKQMNLPGIAPKEYAYKALIEANPIPSTVEEAERFFRAHCDALIKLKKDHDFLRVVLKETSSTEEKEKHEYTCELLLNDQDERDDQYVELAVKVHQMWLDLEAPKHQS